MFSPGDVIAFSGTHPVSWLIRAVTLSAYSHVGVCFQYGSRTLLCESTTLLDTPCEIEHRCFSGVQAQSPFERIRTHQGRVYVLRPYWPYTERDSQELTKFCLNCIGTEYDTLEAGLSGTRRLKHWFVGTENQQFCSELVCRSQQYLRRVPPPPGAYRGPADPSDFNPGVLVKYLTRYWQAYREPELVN